MTLLDRLQQEALDELDEDVAAPCVMVDADVVLKLIELARAAQELVRDYPLMRQGRRLSGPLVDALDALETAQ